MPFDPTPNPRHRFEHHVVISTQEDTTKTINEWLEDAKFEVAERMLLTTSTTDEYPNSLSIDIDMVCMRTPDYRDILCSLYDKACTITAATILEGGAGSNYDPDSIELLSDQANRATEILTKPELSEHTQDWLLDWIARAVELMDKRTEYGKGIAKRGLQAHMEKLKESPKHYKQALKVTAEAMHLLNITIADWEEEQKTTLEELDAEGREEDWDD